MVWRYLLITSSAWTHPALSKSQLALEEVKHIYLRPFGYLADKFKTVETSGGKPAPVTNFSRV
jgi:hypothetical protein